MAKNKVELILTGDAKGATRAFGQVDNAAHGLSGKLGTLGKALGNIAMRSPDWRPSRRLAVPDRSWAGGGY